MDGFLDESGRWRSPLRRLSGPEPPPAHTRAPGPREPAPEFMDGFMDDHGRWKSPPRHRGSPERFRGTVGALVRAVSTGNQVETRRLLKLGADVNGLGTDGFGAVHAAATNDDTGMLTVLLKAKASPNCASRSGLRPLDIALRKGHDKVATALVEGQAALGPVPVGSSVGGSLLSALGIAAIKGLVNSVRAMAKRGADLSERDDDGMTAVHLACLHGQEACLEMLLACGAPAGAPDNEGCTPLHVVCAVGDSAIGALGLLLVAKANPNCQEHAAGNTPLLLAVQKQHCALVKCLAQWRGSDLSVRNAAGQQAIELALQARSTQLADALRAHAAPSAKGSTAPARASHSGLSQSQPGPPSLGSESPERTDLEIRCRSGSLLQELLGTKWSSPAGSPVKPRAKPPPPAAAPVPPLALQELLAAPSSPELRWQQLSRSLSVDASQCDSDGFPRSPSPLRDLWAPEQDHEHESPLQQLKESWRRVHCRRPEEAPEEQGEEGLVVVGYSALHGWREQGVGPRARVYSASWVPSKPGERLSSQESTPVEVAVKRLHLRDPSSQASRLFRQEMRAMQALQHPNVVPVLAVCVEGGELGLLVPLWKAGTSDLHSVVQRRGQPLGARRMLHIALGVANALLYLHTRQPPVVHRRLHSRNVVLEGHATLVADAHHVQDWEAEQSFGLSMPQWVAPEVLLGRSQGEPACDVYSFAMILFEMADGGAPFRAEHTSALSAALAAATNAARPQLSQGAEAFEELLQLMRQCWQGTPEDRPNATEVLKVLSTRSSC